MKRVMFLFTLLIIGRIAVPGQGNPLFSRNIHFNSGKETLYGQMILTDTTGKIPLVVFLSGSGPSSSYRTNYAGFLRFFFEEKLLGQGIALMYFDKRGVGQSTGNWYKTDFYERAADAAAAIDFACNTGWIDPARICVAGHSQGGWIAQIVAARYPERISCAVSMSGATFGVFQQLVNDYQSERVCKGVDSTLAHQKAVQKAQLTMRVVRWFPLTENMKQLKLIGDFDPRKEIQNIRLPVLFTFAGNDELVYPAWCMDVLHGLYPSGIPANFTVKTFPGTDHGYHIAAFCSRDTGKRGHESEEVRQYVTEWMIRQFTGISDGGKNVLHENNLKYKQR
ncbi:MAG: alpha/beta hydrolase [Chlorobi bacterium]|nr:alpha/beta hydrolase [Chlorobiota bacterium]